LETYAEAEGLLAENANRRRDPDVKCIANNTHLVRRNEETIAVRLHSTDVVTYYKDGDVMLNSGGWQTVTTKDRMNRFSPYSVWQEKGIWYVHAKIAKGLVLVPQDLVYDDGVTIHPDGTADGAISRERLREIEKDRRKVAAYVKRFVTAVQKRKIESPNSGDCWFCSMQDEKTEKPLGEATGNTEHLREHVAENYYVPSLLTYACAEAQLAPFDWNTLAAHWSDSDASDADRRVFNSDLSWQRIRRALRAYLFSQLGLGTTR
jgi:hypothetical protein